MMLRFGLFAVLLVSTYAQYGNQEDNCCEDYCYFTDEEPYLSFSTKTAYESVNSRRNNQQHVVPDCQPIQMWGIFRHGSRLPYPDKLQNLERLTKLWDEVRRNFEERRSYPSKGRLCVEDYNLFKSWRWNQTITPQRAGSLTKQGIEELKLLARRYHSKFTELFREPYSERAYHFQYANLDRTHDSYQAFIEGLFGADAFKVHANISPNDKKIEKNDRCKFNVDDLAESRRFQQNNEYQQLTRDVLRRLGFKFTLNASVITDMYDMCRYDKAWNVDKQSPWCVAFTKSQLKLMEYAQDLKFYYKYGYGNDLNRKIGCPTVKDMYDRFLQTINGQSENRGTFYFTGSEVLLTTLTALGFVRDNQPLTADNYYQQSRRQWRTSTISPFAGNLVAVLYRCRSGEQHRVMFFLNEVPVELPECSVGLCNWSILRDKYENMAGTCNLDDDCNQSAAASAGFSLALLLLAVLPFLYKL